MGNATNVCIVLLSPIPKIYIYGENNFHQRKCDAVHETLKILQAKKNKQKLKK